MRNDVMWAVQGGPIVGDIKYGKRYDNGNVTDEAFAEYVAEMEETIEGLDSRLDELEKPDFSISNFSATPSFCECGKVETVILNWGIVGQYTQAYINNEPVAGTTLTVTNVGTDREFTLSVVGLNGVMKSVKTKVTFANRYYWGASASPDFTEANVKSLAFSKISNVHNNEFAINANNEYIFVAYPVRLGSSTILSGGVEGGFIGPEAVRIINAHGYDELYYIYRSANKLKDSFNITVK